MKFLSKLTAVLLSGLLISTTVYGAELTPAQETILNDAIA